MFLQTTSMCCWTRLNESSMKCLQGHTVRYQCRLLIWSWIVLINIFLVLIVTLIYSSIYLSQAWCTRRTQTCSRNTSRTWRSITKREISIQQTPRHPSSQPSIRKCSRYFCWLNLWRRLNQSLPGAQHPVHFWRALPLLCGREHRPAETVWRRPSQDGHVGQEVPRCCEGPR